MRIQVAVELNGATTPAGELYVESGRAVTSTFSYGPAYLRNPDAYELDPAMPLASSASHHAGLPGAFSDAAPDRWGRNLIRKQLQLGGQRSFTDADFLLGVSDETRQGAVRFAIDREGPFVAAHGAVPKLVALPRLLRAAERVAADEDADDAVKLLLEAGTGSLGGARPKAAVKDGDDLYIAKFPHPEDRWDVMAWEATALDLAERAGIIVPERRLIQVGGVHVLLVKRFDRRAAQRIGYLSAMSLVGATDGSVVDYLELAEKIALHSSSPRRDLQELWRRQAFGAAINNTDDHARNHGFLRSGAGWALAPIFDVNPNPEAGQHQMTLLGEARSDRLLQVLLDCAAEFALTNDEAQQQLDKIGAAVGEWPQVARRNGVHASEIEAMRTAFVASRSW